MASSDSEPIPCPSCGKTYRWKPELANRKVVCKACGAEFAFPAHPAPEPTTLPVEDDSLYELASDPDEQRELPPAYEVPADLPKEEPDKQGPVAPPPADPIGMSGSVQPADTPDTGEPEVHISEAAKAARREEQRIAAAEEESVRTWRDYKWLIILITALLALGVLYWAMNWFGDAMEDGLHNTLLPGSFEVFACSNTASREPLS